MMSLSSAECLGISPTASQENITNDILHTLMFPFYNSVAGVCWMLSVTHPMVNDIILGTDSAAKSLQSCPTLCDPTDGSLPGSPVPGILQARTLEWVAISFSNAWKWKVKVKSLSRVRLFATPWTAAYQAPPPMGFSRQELLVQWKRQVKKV